MSHHATLARETAHLSTADRDAIAACFAYAQRLASAVPANVDQVVAVEAIALKLFTLDHTPERWVRVLIAKAALEAPIPWANQTAEDTALIEAAERALRARA